MTVDHPSHPSQATRGSVTWLVSLAVEQAAAVLLAADLRCLAACPVPCQELFLEVRGGQQAPTSTAKPLDIMTRIADALRLWLRSKQQIQSLGAHQLQLLCRCVPSTGLLT